MAQEMSFAQALTEAKQIIVQQSHRIKSDLDKIKGLQDSITTANTNLSLAERRNSEQAAELARHGEQLDSLAKRLHEANTAREQAEAIIDRQGQRLTQSQEMVKRLERQVAEQSEQIGQLTREIDSLRHQLPTQEDSDA